MSGDIHFIERMGHMKCIDRDLATWESSWWAVAPETAEKLVGGRIFFHKEQDKPPFFGGQITSYRVETEGEWLGRIIFTFVFSIVFRGIPADREGWSNEKKIVLPP